MSALPKAHSDAFITPEQYLEQERAAEYKSEYFMGEVVAMAGASRRHNVIGLNIAASLLAQLRDRPCEVYSNDMRVQADRQRQYCYPDVVAVCGEPEFRDGREDTLLNPTVIVEVLSPSTEANDRGEKFLRYRQIASLREYLLVSRRIEQFTRQEDGAWRLSEAADAGTLTLECVGCTLSLEDVYARVAIEPPVRLTLDGPR